MELDLLRILRILRRRWWVLLLLPIVALASSYYTVSRETPQYEATAVFLVNPGALVGSSDYNSLQDSQHLTATYSEILSSQTMRDRVAGSVGYGDIDPGDVFVSTVKDTLLIQVTVTDEDPEVAAETANAFVTEFQAYIQDQNENRLNHSRSSVDQQIDYLNEQIATIDSEMIGASDAELLDLQQQRRTYADMVTQLESDAASISMRTNTSSPLIEPIDEAQVPTQQSSPNVARSTTLGAVIGILLAVGVVALLEYLDSTVKSHSELAPFVNAPLLSSVPIDSGAKSKRGDSQLFTLTQPRSNQAEAIRLLRTNLTFAGVESPLDSLVITSPVPDEGKSTVAANLAVAVAQSGKSVVLVDADLRKPSQATIFGTKSQVGISNYCADHQLTWESITNHSYVSGLTIIPSGPLPPNPAEMISSARFQKLISDLEEEFEFVIIDSPPVHGASDALVVGSMTNGVLLVTQYGSTRIDAVKSATAQIQHSGARLVGIVLNQVKGTHASYVGGYYQPDDK